MTIRELLPERGEGLGVGVGTGRFAVPLGVRVGVEPSRTMGQLQADRRDKTLDYDEAWEQMRPGSQP